MLAGKFLSSLKFPCLHASRLAQDHFAFNLEHSFTITITNMHVNGLMVFAIEEETKTVLGENIGHMTAGQ